MATPLTGWRDARAVRLAVAGGVETEELDFGLGPRMGIELGAVMFGLWMPVFTAASAMISYAAYLSLHAETGTLESLIAEGHRLDTEVLHEAAWLFTAQDEAATRGGSAASHGWSSPPERHYSNDHKMYLVQNATFRVESSNGNLSLTSAFVRVTYRFVTFTDAEMGFLLARRR